MIRYSRITDIGSRAVNEDFAGCFENSGAQCFVVCDGLGGHGMGDAASRVVVECFGEQFRAYGEMSAENASAGNADPKAFLAQTFTDAQEKLLAEQATLHASSKMKTTAVALVTDDKNAYIGHVGDSRCYVFRHNKVLTRTLDHSVPQMLVLSRQLKESQIRNHPDRNLVLKVMGVEWEDPMYELMDPIPLKKCQAFLLCTDGFWELIEEKDMCSLLKKASSPDDWLKQMANIIRKNGEGREMDNFTAIAVWNT